MIAFTKPRLPRLVEIVMCVGGREDHVTELEWDKKYPLPPNGTRILGLSSNPNCQPLIARDNRTGELYFLSYRSDKGYEWQPEFG